MTPLHPTVAAVLANVEQVLFGKTDAIKLCLAALLADGHVLIEDVPGVGKTVLARSLALSFGVTFKRIQFTSDLLPGDVTGVQIYRQDSGTFEFHPGPIMTQVLLADEINRATPKTQSALLESMDERRITVDGLPVPLPDPFLVLATQNPVEFEGTFPLPESQLDRFLVSLRLGYPGRASELAMLARQEHSHPLDDLAPVTNATELRDLQAQVRNTYVADPVRNYVLDVIEATRNQPDIELGASPRATLAVFRLSQAWALMHQREFVLPDDVQAVAGAVLRHRIMPATFLDTNTSLDTMINRLMRRVPIPGNRG